MSQCARRAVRDQALRCAIQASRETGSIPRRSNVLEQPVQHRLEIAGRRQLRDRQAETPGGVSAAVAGRQHQPGLPRQPGEDCLDAIGQDRPAGAALVEGIEQQDGVAVSARMFQRCRQIGALLGESGSRRGFAEHAEGHLASVTGLLGNSRQGHQDRRRCGRVVRPAGRQLPQSRALPHPRQTGQQQSRPAAYDRQQRPHRGRSPVRVDGLSPPPVDQRDPHPVGQVGDGKRSKVLSQQR